MKIVTVSLERAFLNRQFRSIRHLLLGLPPHPGVWPPISSSTTSKSEPLLKNFDLLVQKNSKVVAPSKMPQSATIFEHKRPEENINKQIDYLRSSDRLWKLPIVSVAPVLQISPILPKLNQRSKKNKFLAVLFGGVVAICLILLTVLLAPTAYYSLFPGDPVPIKADTAGSVLGGNYSNGSARVVSKISAPVYDAHLPAGNWLIIPKIGVNTQILESPLPDESLNKGVWRVPDFGTPTDLSKPMILAAHRYGWKAWWENGNQYWKYHSFYLLPDLKPGDIVEVISDHRKYTYEIYAGEQAQDISDYNADLILYTCKFLDSPLRYFRYARLVDPNHPKAMSSK